jgi:hypothetical protein
MTIPRNQPQTVQDAPILQWANGHTQARGAAGGRFGPFVGFHVERGKDADLDALLEAAGTPHIDIRHPRPGTYEIKPHWSFGESVRFYPVTAGPVATTIAGCLRLADATAAAGIGLNWPDGEKSRMAVRGFLLVAGAPILVQLATRSTMTGFLLAALLDHVRVCEAADTMIDRAKHPDVVALHELALPLTAGQEQAAGKGDTTAQIVPFVSDHPAALEQAYISSCWRKNIVHDAAIDAWPGIIVWADGYHTGETNGDSHLDAPVPVAEPAPAYGVKRRAKVARVEEADLPL